MKKTLFNESIRAMREKKTKSLQYKIKVLFILALLCFYSKVYNSNKNLKKNLTFFVNPTCFLLIREKRRSMTNF